jgi:hypothetical protein
MISDGKYTAKLVTAALCETAKGKAVLELGWEILDEDTKGEVVTSYHYFTGGAKTITIETMRALGWSEKTDLLAMVGTTMPILGKTSDEWGQQWRPLVTRNVAMDSAKSKSFLASLIEPTGPAFASQDTDEDGIPF